jgi:peptide chain release factor 1
VTDHRINFTLHELDRVLNGGIEPLVDALVEAEVEERLA